MSWTAPRTWIAGEVVTAALLNAQIRDNELALATVPTVTVATTSSSFVKTADMKWHLVKSWGGGASGSAAGGGGSGTAMGAGGGGAAYCEKLYASSALSASESFTVGVGGSGNSGAGNAGTASTFKSMSAGGGQNGVGMAWQTASALAAAGSGGTASGGDVNLTGDDGGKGQLILGSAISPVFINDGGGSPYGGGRTVLAASAVSAGTAGKFPGGGASGAYSTNPTGQNGGTGAAGQIVITSYYSG